MLPACVLILTSPTSPSCSSHADFLKQAATESGHEAVIERLIEAGCNLDSIANSGAADSIEAALVKTNLKHTHRLIGS